MNTTPEYTAALERYEALRKTLGFEHELTQRALILVLHLLPRVLRPLDELINRAALGLNTAPIDSSPSFTVPTERPPA